MKNYNELNKEEQKKAVSHFLNNLIEAICNGLSFNDELNGDNLQQRINIALSKAEQNKTPWFASEYLMEDKKIKEALEGMAQCDAENSFYLEEYETAIKLK